MSFGTIWWKIIVIVTRYEVRLSCCWCFFSFWRKCHCRTIKTWPIPAAVHENPSACAPRVLIAVSKCRHVRYGYSGNKDVQLDCFATLLQNELKSGVVCVTTHLSCNKSVCCRLWKVTAKRREYLYFLQQYLYMLPVLPAQGKLVLKQVT